MEQAKKKYELFPLKFIENLPSAKEVKNPLIVGLLKYDTSEARSLRRQIERWFDNIPDTEKPDLGARIRSLDDRQHLSGFYELLFHQFFIEDGYSLIKHPPLGNKKPDYLIINNEKHLEFFLEVVTIFRDKNTEKGEKAFDRLLEEISKIKHHFFVSVETEAWPTQNVSYKDLKSKLTSWLDSFDPNIKEQGHTFTYNLNGCNIKFELIPKKNSTKDSIYGMYMGPGYHGPGTSTQIRNQIQSKIRKYGVVKDKAIPLVVAVCSSGAWGIDEYNLETELFGKLQTVFNLKNPKKSSETKRDCYGLFTPKPALRGVRNTRLSAVLFCKRIWNQGRAVYNMRAFHNPWASCPLNQSIFSKLPQFVKIKEENNIITCGWINDNKQVVIFS